ncbi:lipopolysaccharide biosynthesis protein [Phycisphaeraceae bacterium D3-23]
MLNKLTSRPTQILKLLRDREIDLSTPEGRSKDRYRRAALTSAMLILARGMNIVTGLATIPITLSYLGDDLFGIWMALTSFVVFLGFTDLGLGVGIQNALIQCHGDDDRDTPGRVVGMGLLALCTIAAILCAVALYALPNLPLTDWVKFEDPGSARWLLPTAQVMLVCFALGLPIGIAQRLCDAYQRGYWGYGMLMVGRTLGFVGVCIAALGQWSLPVLAGVYLAAPFAVMLLGTLFLVLPRMPWLIPRWPGLNGKLAHTLFGTGTLVLLSHIGRAVFNSAPALLIASQISAAAVAPYAVTQKLIGVATLAIAPIVLSLWSPIGEAAVRGDVPWIKRALRRTLRYITLAYAPVALVLVLLGRPIIALWTGQSEAVPGWSLLLAVVCYASLTIYGQLTVTILGALNRFALRAAATLSLAALATTLCIVYRDQLGTAGIIWVFALAGYLPLLLVLSLHARHLILALPAAPANDTPTPTPPPPALPVIQP